VSFNKKLFFIFLAIYSLLTVSVQGNSYAFEKYGEGKTELKKYFFQAHQSQSLQRSDFKEKRQSKSYPPEFLFLATPHLAKFFFTKISPPEFTSFISVTGSFSVSNRPRAPPV